MPVLLLLRRGINQTWVRGRVLRFEFLDRFKIRRVGDDFCELLQLIELIQLRFTFFLFSSSGAHSLSFGLRSRRDSTSAASCKVGADALKLNLNPSVSKHYRLLAFGERTRPRVLAMTPSSSRTFLHRKRSRRAVKSLFRRGAETSTRGACAPQTRLARLSIQVLQCTTPKRAGSARALASNQ